MNKHDAPYLEITNPLLFDQFLVRAGINKEASVDSLISSVCTGFFKNSL